MTLLTVVAALVFGGADQYLGSLAAHPWAADVSLLSAPWLAVPFVAGRTQRSAKRAMLVGLAATAAALAGYALMTLSPIENAHFTLRGLEGFIRSDPSIFYGGAVTGPLFGWLAYAHRRSGLLALAALACLEPVAHLDAGSAIRFPSVAVGEVLAGAALAAYVSAARAMRSCSTR